MELEQLKTLWIEQDKKLDRSLQLNMRLLHQINFNKAGNKLRTLLFLKTIEMAILLFMIIALCSYTVKYITDPGFCIPALIITGFIVSGYISDIRQLALIVQIRADDAAPVSQLQKLVERLKILIVNYTKMSFISIPFYPLLLIVSARIFFHVDFWAPQFHAYLIANVITGLLLVPVFIWLFIQLSKQNIKNIHVKNFLSGSGWNQATLAQQFLNEIEQFERGDS